MCVEGVWGARGYLGGWGECVCCGGWRCLVGPAPARAPAPTHSRSYPPPPPPQNKAIPGLSPVPWWGTLFPLAVVLTVNGVKEAFDDYWRHVSDAQVNRR